MQRQQEITVCRCDQPKGERAAPPAVRRAGVVPAQGALSRAQGLLELACRMTRSAVAGVGLVSADGALVEHVAAGLGGAAPGPECYCWVPALAGLAEKAAGGAYRTDLGDGPPGAGWPDEVPAGPFLALPLAYPNRCRAVLYLARRPGAAPFGDDDVASARVVGACFEQGSVFEECHLLTRLQVLNKVAQAGASSFDLGRILGGSLDELSRQLPFHVCAAWLFEDGPDAAVCLAEVRSLGAALPRPPSPPPAAREHFGLEAGLRLAPGQTPFAPCLKDGEALYLDMGWPEALATELGRRLAEGGAACSFAVPLRAGDLTVGVLQSLCAGPSGFTTEQVQLLYLAADLLGPAISNCQLYGRLRGAYDQLKLTQHQLVQSEKMRALGELAGGMAHDFNNALCGAIGFLELVLLDRNLDAPSRKNLEAARTCALDAAQTVRRVQDFSRWRRNDLSARRVDLNELVRETVELTRPRWENFAQGRGAVIAVSVEPGDGAQVLGSPAELREVLTTFVFNAVDAMPAGGRLTVRTSCARGSVFVAVSDTGVGMSEAVRRRLFEPFFSTKGERGNGLGLSVAFGIVQRHGGEIAVESEVDRGSTFTLRLPAAAPGPEEGEGRSPAPGAVAERARGLRVLVVEDEATVRHFLGMGLKRLGHHPVLTADAKEALAALDAGLFDVVLTDLGLPGVSGEEVARLVAQRAPATPVVLLTGWADQVRAERGSLEGVACILGKPVTLDTLGATLASVCPP